MTKLRLKKSATATISKSWQRGFDAARAASLYSNGKRIGKRMGAALFNGSTLISIGFNQYHKSHPFSCPDGIDRKIHAEMSAVIKRRYYDDYGNLIMYVWRENEYGPAHSRPCSLCMQCIKVAGVKRVRFLNSDGEPEEIRI